MLTRNNLIINALVFVFSVALTGVPFLTISRLGLETSLYIMFLFEFVLALGVACFFYKGVWKNLKMKLLINCLLLIISLQLLSYTLKAHSIGSASLSMGNVIPYLFTVFIIPFYEEVIYRGCVFDFFNRVCKGRFIFSGFITSVIFCLMHTQYMDFFDYVILFLISMILIFSRISSGGLSTPVLLHSSMNAFVIILNVQSFF